MFGQLGGNKRDNPAILNAGGDQLIKCLHARLAAGDQTAVEQAGEGADILWISSAMLSRS